MTNTQNGWPLADRSQIATYRPLGGTTKVLIPVRRGDVATVLMWCAREWHRTVEPLDHRSCWGFDPSHRPIRGTTATYSNHGSGTAIDLNATQHPLGVPVSKTFTPTEVAAIRALVKKAGVVVSGVEWRRPDGMHLEIRGTAAQVAAAAKRLAGAPAPARTAPRWVLTRILGVPDRGEDVKTVQRRVGVPVDGIFGPVTKAAVVKWQAKYGLARDGVVGPKTAAAFGWSFKAK